MTVKRIVANIAAKEVGSAQAYQIKILVLNLALEFFQECDLAGMVELVLCNAVKHVIEVVLLAGHAIAQAGIREAGYSLHKPVVRPFRLGDGLAPGRFRSFGRGRKIVQTRELTFFSAKPNHARVVPGRDVQDEFPYAVRVCQWPGGCARRYERGG